MEFRDTQRRRPHALGGDAAAALALALDRARRHGRNAARESAAALRAITEVAALAATGEPTSARRLRGQLWRALEDLGGAVGRATDRSGLLDGVVGAIDAEIARWEARSQREPEARAVLRTFFALREVLWELGVTRRSGGPSDATQQPASGDGSGATVRQRRIERIRVEG